MNKENTLKLYTDFPMLYRQHSLSPQETIMCFGFEHGDGWFSLVYNLSKKLMEIDQNIQAVQVKEKFGSLRFYVGSVRQEVADQVYTAISEAEEISSKTCEQCGKSGKPNKSGWIHTLCTACRKTRTRDKGSYLEDLKDKDKGLKNE